jgi:hypothetical protein
LGDVFTIPAGPIQAPATLRIPSPWAEQHSGTAYAVSECTPTQTGRATPQPAQAP